MFRLNKLADYALVVMEYVASHRRAAAYRPRLAEATHSRFRRSVKILKNCWIRGLGFASRVKGGYAAARPLPDFGSGNDRGDRGPMGLTECATAPGRCELEGRCRIQDNSVIIGRALQQALGNISLSDLTATLGTRPTRPDRSNIVPSITPNPRDIGSRGVQ